jgi:hypothetical protein
MALSSVEKRAGTAFLEEEVAKLNAANVLLPPDIVVRYFGPRHYRHECPARGGRSVSFDIREVYILSPQLWVCYCSSVLERPHGDCQGAVKVEAGRFGFFYREGKCACDITARSLDGLLVDAYERPPLGRVS